MLGYSLKHNTKALQLTVDDAAGAGESKRQEGLQ